MTCFSFFRGVGKISSHFQYLPLPKLLFQLLSRPKGNLRHLIFPFTLPFAASQAEIGNLISLFPLPKLLFQLLSHTKDNLRHLIFPFTLPFAASRHFTTCPLLRGALLVPPGTIGFREGFRTPPVHRGRTLPSCTAACVL